MRRVVAQIVLIFSVDALTIAMHDNRFAVAKAILLLVLAILLISIYFILETYFEKKP